MKRQSRYRSWHRSFLDHAPYVREPREGDRILAIAEHNPKLGGDIERRGTAPSRVVYLEEYGTCSDQCRFKRDGNCWGENSKADRFIVTEMFWTKVEHEIVILSLLHSRWFLRLHGLGDFFSVEYVERWIALATKYEQMWVWGFTGRRRDSNIGHAIQSAMDRFGPRWRTLWSEQVAQRGTTRCFELHELTRTSGEIDLIQHHEGIAYPLCPEQIDQFLLHKSEGEIRRCSDCRRCILTDCNVGFLYHGPDFHMWRRKPPSEFARDRK